MNWFLMVKGVPARWNLVIVDKEVYPIRASG